MAYTADAIDLATEYAAWFTAGTGEAKTGQVKPIYVVIQTMKVCALCQ